MITKNQRGESFVSVIVGVTIIMGIFFTLGSILAANNALEKRYVQNNNIFLLKNNITAILKKMDTNSISEGELFFLQKDNSGATFQVKTGTLNAPYRYINDQLENIGNTGSYAGSIYTHWLYMERKAATNTGTASQVIKVGIRELIRK